MLWSALCHHTSAVSRTDRSTSASGSRHPVRANTRFATQTTRGGVNAAARRCSPSPASRKTTGRSVYHPVAVRHDEVHALVARLCAEVGRRAPAPAAHVAGQSGGHQRQARSAARLRQVTLRPPCLRADGLDAKAPCDGRRDQPQQRIAETGDDDAEDGEADAERDGAIRGTHRHRG